MGLGPWGRLGTGHLSNSGLHSVTEDPDSGPEARGPGQPLICLLSLPLRRPRTHLRPPSVPAASPPAPTRDSPHIDRSSKSLHASRRAWLLSRTGEGGRRERTASDPNRGLPFPEQAHLITVTRSGRVVDRERGARMGV